MAITASFDAGAGMLSVLGDSLDNTITTSLDAAGNVLINEGGVAILGGQPTVANTNLIQVFGQGAMTPSPSTKPTEPCPMPICSAATATTP
jgi:hypothetical protein